MAAIIFDYNGVIVDDEQWQFKAMAAILKQQGIELSWEQYIDWCLGRPDQTGFLNIALHYPALLEGTSLDHIIQQKFEAYQTLVVDQSLLVPGIIPLIESLAQHFKLAIVSGALRAEIDAVLQVKNLHNLFSPIITAEDTKKGKPDPEGYQLAITLLDISPTEAIVIEDTSVGIIAAQAAGAKGVAVSQTHRPQDLYQAALILPRVTDLTIAQLTDLLGK